MYVKCQYDVTLSHIYQVKLNDVDECSKYEKYHCLQIHTEKTNIQANLTPLKITLQGIEDTKTYFLKHDEVFDESGI